MNDKSPEARNRKERLLLWDTYGLEMRCIGDHLVHAHYCCLHCDSEDPSTICHKEKTRHVSVCPSDYVDPDMRREVNNYKVLGIDPKEIPIPIDAVANWSGDCPTCNSGIEIPYGETDGRCSDCGQRVKLEIQK